MGVAEYENKVKKVQTRNGQYSGYFDGVNRSEKPLGFCHCSKHKGYVSSDLLKTHNCLGRECTYFCKYEDSPYFIDRHRRNKAKRDGCGTQGKVRPLHCSGCGKSFNPLSTDTLMDLLRRARKQGWRIHKDHEECKDCAKCRKG